MVKEGEEHVLTGTERMKHRPIGILVDALRFLGADIEYVGEEGFPHSASVASAWRVVCWKCPVTSAHNISLPC